MEHQNRYFRSIFSRANTFITMFLEPIIRIFVNTLTLCIKQQSARRNVGREFERMLAEWKQKSKFVIFEPRFEHSAKFADCLAGEEGSRRTIVYRKAELENIRVICTIVYAKRIFGSVTRANLRFPTTICSSEMKMHDGEWTKVFELIYGLSIKMETYLMVVCHFGQQTL